MDKILDWLDEAAIAFIKLCNRPFIERDVVKFGYDVALISVLGRGIPNGKPTLALKASLDRALSLITENVPVAQEIRCMLHGGWSELGDKPGNTSEALVMATYIVNNGYNGIPVLDYRSMDTVQSLEVFSILKKEMDKTNSFGGSFKSFIVCDFTHYLRTRFLVWRMGLKDVTVVASNWDHTKGDLNMRHSPLILREFLGIAVAMLPLSWVSKLRKLGNWQKGYNNE